MAQSELPSSPIEIVNFFFKGIVPENEGNHPGGMLDVAVKEVWNSFISLPHIETEETRDVWQKGSLRIAKLAKQIALKCATLAEKQHTLFTLQDTFVDTNMNESYNYWLLMPDKSDPGRFLLEKVRPDGRDTMKIMRDIERFASPKITVYRKGEFDDDQFKYELSFWPNREAIIEKFTLTEGIYTPKGDRVKEIVTSIDSPIDPDLYQKEAKSRSA